MNRSCVIFALLTLTPIAYAQSAVESSKWLLDFIASKGGSEASVFFDDDVMSKSRSEILPYADIRKVESWNTNNEANSYFVRVTGTLYDCTNADGWDGVGEIRAKCKPRPGVVDIELWEDRVHSADNASRIVKAIIHLAELHGTKVNQPELF